MTTTTPALYQPPSGNESKIISPFLELKSTGIHRLGTDSDTEALLAFWFSIAEGELLGRPWWGHPFKPRLFGAGGRDQIVVSEMLAIRKLRRDIPQLKISGIKGEYIETDLLALTVFYPSGQGVQPFTGKVSQ